MGQATRRGTRRERKETPKGPNPRKFVRSFSRPKEREDGLFQIGKVLYRRKPRTKEGKLQPIRRIGIVSPREETEHFVNPERETVK